MTTGACRSDLRAAHWAVSIGLRWADNEEAYFEIAGSTQAENFRQAVLFFEDARDLVQLRDQVCVDAVVECFVFQYFSTSQVR